MEINTSNELPPGLKWPKFDIMKYFAVDANGKGSFYSDPAPVPNIGTRSWKFKYPSIRIDAGDFPELAATWDSSLVKRGQ